MSLMNVSNIKKVFGAEELFSGVSFTIEEKEKIGLVGTNGAGKTTLFKILLDEMNPDGGEIYRSKQLIVDYLEQHTLIDSERTVYNEVMEIYSELVKIEDELTEITLRISSNPQIAEDFVERQSILNEKFEQMGGYVFKNRVKSALIGLGFSENELNKPVNELSGGQKTRVMLCKILLGNSNLLFLDEPTNHLDIESVEWLENFLVNEYKGAFVVISHDRYFLDRVTNKTLEIENGKLRIYSGNYSTFVKLKEERRKSELNHFSNTRKEIKRIEGIIKQQKQWNREKNIKTAESKQKMIDRLEAGLVVPDEEQKSLKFRFEAKTNSGNDVLMCDKVKMGFGSKILFDNADMFIKKKENVFLLGPNGCGKTTFLKLVTNKLSALSGEIRKGANVEIGYYDQIQSELNLNKDAFEEIHDSYPDMTETEIRNAMATFLFTGDDVFKKISVLSGGERARIELIKLMLGRYNFLILDEPTNHLDIASREALEDALAGYDGTILAVSHDRYFINKLASTIYEMKTDGFNVFRGDYDYYLEKRNEKENRNEIIRENTSSKEEYLKRKQDEAEKRKNKNKIAKLEQQIAELEEEISKIEEELASPEVATDYVRATELSEENERKNEKLLSLYEEWEELSE